MIVRVTGAAAADLEDLESWLQARSPAAAERLTVTLRGMLASLSSLPNRGRPGVEPGTRELVVQPYVITYRVAAAEVVVLGVRHHAQLR